jgi:hypothetical protein
MIQEEWNFSLEFVGTDASMVLKIKPELTRFLHQFDDCFGRVTTRRYLDVYVEGRFRGLDETPGRSGVDRGI